MQIDRSIASRSIVALADIAKLLPDYPTGSPESIYSAVSVELERLKHKIDTMERDQLDG